MLRGAGGIRAGRGGGVATQVSGVMRDIGPDRVAVDAPFQPGNSGSLIEHVASGEVLGLATYSEACLLDLFNGVTEGSGGGRGGGEHRRLARPVAALSRRAI